MRYLAESTPVIKHSLTAPSVVEAIPQLGRLKLCIDIPPSVDPFVDVVTTPFNTPAVIM